MEYEYKDFHVTIFKDGEHILTDLEMYRREHEKVGWEYIGMVTIPTDDPKKAEVVLRFKRKQDQ